MIRAGVLVLLLTAACTVPDLVIEEQTSVSVERDASAADSDAGVEADAARDAGPRTRDSGTEVRTGQGSAEGAAGNAAAGGSGGSGKSASAGAGGAAGQAGAPQPGAAGTGGSAGAPEPMQPTRSCLVWTSINIRSGPPPGAFEGGFETIAGVTTRQYICRFRPPGSTYAIPGKYVDSLGCYVTQRVGAQVEDSSVLDGLIDVLVPAPGCTLSWRAATPSELPAGVVDLGDPADGRNYACRGEYANIGTNGNQIGSVIRSTDNPPLNQCWFESFADAILPEDPSKFEVLVLDPQ
jgi:hypothetical protein